MTKQEILDAIQKLPDDATYDDAIERLEFLRLLKHRLDSLDRGAPTLSQEEVKARAAKWPK